MCSRAAGRRWRWAAIFHAPATRSLPETDGASRLYDRPLPSLLKDENEGRGWNYIVSLFPTGLAWVADRYAIYVLFTPMGWNKTRVVFHLYLAGEAASDPALADHRAVLFEEWKLIGQQDIPFVKYVHANLEERDRIGIRPRFSSYWEEAVHYLQKIVVATIREQETAS
jgi:hypothetical protein